MSLWGKINQANNAPKYKAHHNSANSGVQSFEAIPQGVYGIYANVSAKTHSGWVLRTRGTGPVTSLTISSGGTGYANSDTISVSGGTTNATANITTNGSGVITGFTNLSGGSGFRSNTTVTITTSGGSTANIVPVLGGRAGRISDEVLVTLNTMTAP